MGTIRKKISELTPSTAFNGLWTIGVDALNRSVRVSLQYIADTIASLKSGVETTIGNADKATQRANTAAANADNSRKAIEANEQTRQSNEQTRQSNEQTRNSNETTRINNENARKQAENARVTAELNRVTEHATLKKNAEDATKAANDAAKSVDDSKKAAEDATTKAINASNDAKIAAMRAEEATIIASDTATHPTYIGDDYYVYYWDTDTKSYNKTDIFLKGDGFSIFKTYTSIDQMENDADTVPDGQFVLINTDNVENPDNAKLYIKKNNEFSFLVDLSGALGFTGKTPQISIGTVSHGDTASATLSPNGQDTGGNPQFKLNLILPKGNPGNNGAVFTPAVDSSGNLSWSNNGGLTNPAAVNIKGPKGNPGNNGAVFTPAVDSSGNLSWSNNGGLTNPAAVNIKGPKGSDATVTKAAIEAVLTGLISSHSHAVPSTVALKDFSNVSVKRWGETGYYKLPDGLMIQWGHAKSNIDSNSVQSVYMPTAFYDKNYVVFVTAISAFQQYYVGRTVCNQYISYFQVSSNQKNQEDFFWLAVGRWK